MTRCYSKWMQMHAMKIKYHACGGAHEPWWHSIDFIIAISRNLHRKCIENNNAYSSMNNHKILYIFCCLFCLHLPLIGDFGVYLIRILILLNIDRKLISRAVYNFVKSHALSPFYLNAWTFSSELKVSTTASSMQMHVCFFWILLRWLRIIFSNKKYLCKTSAEYSKK